MVRIILMASLLAFAASAQALYSGAEMRTRAAYVYGRFEVRMRSAAGYGLVSSFFTYSDASYPVWNEIDIENLGRYPNESQFNQITGQAGSEVNHVRRYATGFNPHQGYHVYVFEWYPDSVVYYVDGLRAHRAIADAAQLKHPQKIMMNLWASSYSDWVGPFNPAILPVYAFYDYVAYSAYTPKAGPGGSDFTPAWRDDFDSWNSARWDVGTHTFEGNLAQFSPDNVAMKDGAAILCLTEQGKEGFKGVVPSAVRPWSPLRNTGAGARFRVDGRAAANGGLQVAFPLQIDVR